MSNPEAFGMRTDWLSQPQSDVPLTTVERDLVKLHQLLCAAMAEWIRPEPGEPGWPREAQAAQEIYAGMHEVFNRYPGVLFHDARRAANPLAVDWESWTPEQRLALLGELDCCRHCGDLNPRCQCNNDE